MTSYFDPEPFKDAASRLIGAALVDRSAWDKLAFLGDSFGHRLNGSPNLDLAVKWALDEMYRENLENVRGEEVTVPNWIRGRESVTILDPVPRDLVMMSYGNSVGTPPEGITAEAIVVSSFEELDARASEVSGKIVVYSPVWTPFEVDEAWENYLLLRHFRISGHSKAAKYGGVAVLMRAIYPAIGRQAHTGALTYQEGDRKIPSASLAPEDALMLERIARRGERIRLNLKMEARSEGTALSENVIGEIVGREKPEEVIVIGGQYDSWDNGVSAIDDGCGCILTWEALRLMKKLDLRPRRTVRVVLFANEENGGSGGFAYRDRYRDELHNHVAMIEADSGVLLPMQFRVSGTPEAIEIVRGINTLVETLGMGQLGTPVRVGTAEDIHASCDAGDIPSLTLQGNNEPYSLYHHAPCDMVEAVPPEALARATAAMSVMTYVLAEMPDRLPTGKGAGARGTYVG